MDNLTQTPLIELLNEMIHPFMSEVEKDLNKWSVSKKHNDFIKNNTPKLDSKKNAAVLYPSSHDAFILKDYQPLGVDYVDDTENDQIVVRCLVPYSLAYNIVFSKQSIDDLKPLIKKMINDLEKTLGFGPDKLNYGTYGVFRRPGTKAEYFRDSERFAGYELRLYSNAVLCE